MGIGRVPRLAAAVLGGLIALGCGPSGPPLKNYEFGRDFQLTDQDGRARDVRLADGNLKLLFFGYTHCPDFCPNTVSRVRKALRQVEAGPDVPLYFVTVDPERDGPRELKDYLSSYNMNLVGLTGTVAQVKAVVTSFQADFERSSQKTAAGYLMNHATQVYVIDGKGRTRYLFRYQEPPEELARVLRSLL